MHRKLTAVLVCALMLGVTAATAVAKPPMVTLKAARELAHSYLVDQLRMGNSHGFRLGPSIRISPTRVLFIPVERCALPVPEHKQTTYGPLYLAPGEQPCRDIQFPMIVDRDSDGVFIDWQWYFIDP